MIFNIASKDVDYQILVDKIVALRTCKKKLDDSIQVQTVSFSELERFLQNWEVRYDLDTIVEDVNSMLSDPSVTDNVLQLQGRLNEVKEEVDKLEKVVLNLKKKYGELCEKPDRHGKFEVAQKVDDFFVNSLRQLHISQIGQTIDVILPELIRNIQAVLDAFEKENAQCAINIELADKLLKRIRVFRGFADKFNSRNICATCESRINSIMQPQRINTDEDKITLDQVQKELDKLRDLYDEEQNQFDELEEEIENSIENIWKEDYEDFMPVFDDPSCMVESTIEELRSSYEDHKARKYRDIREVENRYGKMTFPRGEMILDQFSSEIYSIRKNHVSKRKLNELVSRIDCVVRERRKKILKIVGLLAGIIVVVLIVFYNWEVILKAIAGVLGAIALVWFLAHRD